VINTCNALFLNNRIARSQQIILILNLKTFIVTKLPFSVYVTYGHCHETRNGVSSRCHISV